MYTYCRNTYVYFETQNTIHKGTKVLSSQVDRGSMQALDKYISPYQMPKHPPNLDVRTLLICEVPCSLFKDRFQTRVYCLVLVVVTWLVLWTRSSFLREIRPPNHDRLRGNGHIHIPSLKPL
jgi:hypothetical protein